MAKYARYPEITDNDVDPDGITDAVGVASVEVLIACVVVEAASVRNKRETSAEGS